MKETNTNQNILSENFAKLNLTLAKVEELLHSERESSYQKLLAITRDLILFLLNSENRDLDEQRKSIWRNRR